MQSIFQVLEDFESSAVWQCCWGVHVWTAVKAVCSELSNTSKDVLVIKNAIRKVITAFTL